MTAAARTVSRRIDRDSHRDSSMIALLRRLLRAASTAAGRAPEVLALRESNAVMTSLLAAAAKITAGESSNDVVQCLCDAVVDATRHIRLAWFWYGALDSEEIRPMLAAGPAVAYAQQLVIKRGLLTWRGPAYRALLTERATVTRTFHLAPYGPWRAAIRDHDLRVAIALPLRLPDPARTIAEFDYEHPIFDAAAIAALRRLPKQQGRRRLWFAGAWTGYGFHEDGLRSGLAVAQGLCGLAQGLPPPAGQDAWPTTAIAA